MDNFLKSINELKATNCIFIFKLVNEKYDYHHLGKLRKWSQWAPDQHQINKRKKMEALKELGIEEEIKHKKKQRGGKKQKLKKELRAKEETASIEK